MHVVLQIQDYVLQERPPSQEPNGLSHSDSEQQTPGGKGDELHYAMSVIIRLVLSKVCICNDALCMLVKLCGVL